MRTTRQKHKAQAKTEEKRHTRRLTKTPTVKVEIAFANKKAAHYFALWLCEAGEQDYWAWMECREEEEEGPITAVVLDYWARNGGEFGTKIATTCGRIGSTSPSGGGDG